MVASALVVGGCGGGDDAPTTTPAVSSRKDANYDTAKLACGQASAEALARSLGLSASDRAAIAKKYAEQHAPLALRGEVEQGCLAGLTK